VSLNIKNERVHELARQAAKLTGKSQTSVIEEALRRYLADVTRNDLEDERDRRLKEILAAFDDARARGVTFPDHDFLYDPDTGLPA
jgi:antitoxin VapB